MSILSFEYLGLVGISSLVLWIFHHVSVRKYAVALCNIAFLYLLRADLTGYLYAAGLTAVTWLFGFLLQKKKSLLLLIPGVLLPIGGLCWFKYAGYFINVPVIMPLGLSFYTFKAVSYIADVYKGKAADRDPVLVFDYICFFPAFSAGPIHPTRPSMYPRDMSRINTITAETPLKNEAMDSLLSCYPRHNIRMGILTKQPMVDRVAPTAA